MSEELKPCPFCGALKLEILTTEDMFDTSSQLAYQVVCVCCETLWYETKEEAIEAWNKRVIPKGYVKIEDVIKVINHGWNEYYICFGEKERIIDKRVEELFRKIAKQIKKLEGE
jgi:Lar family restriction alleviation protein